MCKSQPNRPKQYLLFTVLSKQASLVHGEHLWWNRDGGPMKHCKGNPGSRRHHNHAPRPSQALNRPGKQHGTFNTLANEDQPDREISASSSKAARVLVLDSVDELLLACINT